MQLTSLKNPHILRVRKLLTQPHFRKEEGCFVLEHRAAIIECMAQFPRQIDTLFYTAQAPLHVGLHTVKAFEVSEHVMEGMSGLKSHQGLLAVVKKKSWDLISLAQNSKCVLLLDHIQSPGNVGAIIRNAAAFSVETVLCLGTADPYHPESIRGMGGNCFQVPFGSIDLNQLQHLNDFLLWALDCHAQPLLGDQVFKGKNMFILGSEGQGISETLNQAFSIKRLKIEMSGKVESLNVAVSSGILLYHLSERNKEKKWD